MTVVRAFWCICLAFFPLGASGQEATALQVEQWLQAPMVLMAVEPVARQSGRFGVLGDMVSSMHSSDSPLESASKRVQR